MKGLVMEEQQKSKNNEFKWGEFALLAISITSLLTALFGFGVAAGFSVVFGFDPTMFFDNTFDLLALSWHGFAQLLIKLPSPDELYWAMFRNSLGMYIPIGIAVVTISFLYFCSKNKTILNFHEKFKKKQAEAKEETKRMLAFGGLLLLAPLVFPFVMLTLWVCFVLIFMTPVVVGYVSAKTFSNEQIVYPAHCAVVHSREVYMEAIKQLKKSQKQAEENSAQCVLVKSIDKDKPYQSAGRLVNGTSRYVMLYHKSTGITERIPLDGMIVNISSTD
jgi:hypothetical protein